MSLTLAGLGLNSEKDISLRAIEEAKSADKIYVEFYTGKWYGSLESLEKLFGKKVVELSRKDMEDESDKIIQEAKNSKIVIFIEGDPLIQTTHGSLVIEARKNKIQTRIIHNASILSSIGETGLHSQKFGQHTSIPFPEKTKNTKPESFFEVVKRNLENGLHTLCLLDMIYEEKRYMSVNQGLEILLSGVLNENDKVIVFSKAGSDKPLIVYDTIENLIKKNINGIPSVIIIPGKLHFTEKDFLENI